MIDYSATFQLEGSDSYAVEGVATFSEVVPDKAAVTVDGTWPDDISGKWLIVPLDPPATHDDVNPPIEALVDDVRTTQTAETTVGVKVVGVIGTGVEGATITLRARSDVTVPFDTCTFTLRRRTA